VWKKSGNGLYYKRMKRRFIVKKILFLAVLASALFSAGCFGEKMTLEQLLDNGVKAALNGDWEKARNFSGRAVKLAPNNGNALILSALALENTGDSEGALGAASKAVSLDEKNYFAQYTKGRILYEKKHFDSCIAPLRAALKLRPNAVDPLILLAQSSVSLNNGKDAKYYYSALARNRNFAKNPAPWSELGMVFLAEHKPAQAEQYLRYAYTLQPENPRLLLNLAVYYDSFRKNRLEAVKLYSRFLVLTKENSSLSARRAEVESRLKSIQ